MFNKIRVAILQRESPALSQARVAAQMTAAAVNGENMQHIKAVLERVKAVNPFDTELWLEPAARLWIEKNVSLVRSMTEEMLSEMEHMIFEKVRTGVPKKMFLGELQDKFNISKSRAKLIARDQVSKFNGQLTQERQTRLGIGMYFWRGTKDERERGNPTGKYPNAIPSHWEINDKLCRWDNAEVYSEDSGKTWKKRTRDMPKEHPGQPIQCRCWADPVLYGDL